MSLPLIRQAKLNCRHFTFPTAQFRYPQAPPRSSVHTSEAISSTGTNCISNTTPCICGNACFTTLNGQSTIRRRGAISLNSSAKPLKRGCFSSIRLRALSLQELIDQIDELRARSAYRLDSRHTKQLSQGGCSDLESVRPDHRVALQRLGT